MKFANRWAFKNCLKMFKSIRLFNYLKLWEPGTQLWLSDQLVQAKPQYFKSWKKSRVRLSTQSTQNLLQFHNCMAKCIHKHVNGLMVFSPKLSVLQMKSQLLENNSQDGFYMMVMSMLFGYKIWTVWWMTIDCSL